MLEDNSSRDPTIAMVVKMVSEGIPVDKMAWPGGAKQYFWCKDDLLTMGPVLLYKDWVVLPPELHPSQCPPGCHQDDRQGQACLLTSSEKEQLEAAATGQHPVSHQHQEGPALPQKYPQTVTLASPQVLFGRPIRNFIPILPHNYKPREEWRLTMEQREIALSKRHFSEHTKTLTPLTQNAVVMVKNQTGRHAL